ncbi:hypothetical protein NDI54_05850 [Haloarcula sp. S1AR25-5A]|uniref:Uncharacterized protein n=1 Tax=Haloarcula terrestris TaxID=2950533 RepID=A0AAE4EX51_9EURY|nr:hypothetical protein [Haloarcula terrestris]MDS0220877.1 hypothetical protein [Haloarcula terrestris]
MPADRRAFLEAAAVVATMPADALAGVAPAEPATEECDICGAAKPAGMVERTTVPPIAPLEADICAVCQFTQEHTQPDGVCMECGEPVDPGFSIELEYALGEADLPALKTGQLCGDCSSWVASDISHRGLMNDDEARETYRELVDAEHERMAALEGSR